MAKNTAVLNYTFNAWWVVHIFTLLVILSPTAQLNAPFYYIFYPDVSHVRFCTRLSPLSILQVRKGYVGAWERCHEEAHSTCKTYHTDTTHKQYRRSGNFCVKNNSREKFSRFRSIREIFLTVDDCNMDERLESLWLLVYYQVSGKPGIGSVGSVDLRASLFTEYRCVIYFSRV